MILDGRESHSRGQGFETPQLHSSRPPLAGVRRFAGSACAARRCSRGWCRAGVSPSRASVARGAPGAAFGGGVAAQRARVARPQLHSSRPPLAGVRRFAGSACAARRCSRGWCRAGVSPSRASVARGAPGAAFGGGVAAQRARVARPQLHSSRPPLAGVRRFAGSASLRAGARGAGAAQGSVARIRRAERAGGRLRRWRCCATRAGSETLSSTGTANGFASLAKPFFLMTAERLLAIRSARWSLPTSLEHRQNPPLLRVRPRLRHQDFQH